MEFIFVIVLGLVIGSFLNVCIFRIPAEESLSFPTSHCGSCGHNLGPLDLVPLLSYVFLKGKCRYCKSHISIQYPIIEVFNAIMYLLIAYKYGFTITTLKFCIMTSVLIVIAMIDLKTQYVYSSVTIFGGICAAVCITAQYILYKENISTFVIGGLIGSAVIAVIVFLTHGMGEGDIEIAALCGLFLGIKGILLTLFIAVIIGGCVGIMVITLKHKDLKDKIAFGPCLAAGAVISALAGNEIINIYLNLFI